MRREVSFLAKFYACIVWFRLVVSLFLKSIQKMIEVLEVDRTHDNNNGPVNQQSWHTWTLGIQKFDKFFKRSSDS